MSLCMRQGIRERDETRVCSTAQASMPDICVATRARSWAHKHDVPLVILAISLACNLQKSHIGAVVGLLSLLTFEITTMASPTMITVESQTSNLEVYIGAFQTDCDGDGCKESGFQDHMVKCYQQNHAWVSLGGGQDTDCSKSLVPKVSAHECAVFAVCAFAVRVTTTFTMHFCNAHTRTRTNARAVTCSLSLFLPHFAHFLTYDLRVRARGTIASNHSAKRRRHS
jgi:hypothetical protein